MSRMTTPPPLLEPVERKIERRVASALMRVRPAVAEVLKLAHAYADAKLMRYGLLNIANPPDPQVAFEALEAALDAAVAAEREHHGEANLATQPRTQGQGLREEWSKPGGLMDGPFA